MPNIQRIWNRNDQNLADQIIESKNQREQELIKLFNAIKKDLSKTAENRNIRDMLKRVDELRQEEQEGCNAMQSIIDKHEKTCFGTCTVNTVKGCSLWLTIGSFWGTILSVMASILERFEDNQNTTETTTTSVFIVTAAVFTTLFTCGLGCLYSGQKATDKALKYRKLTWDERKELKVLLKYFRELEALHQVDSETINEKFEQLKTKTFSIPHAYGNAPIFKSTNELMNYLLLSLPSDHSIREKLKTLEEFATTASLPHSVVKSDEDASYATSEYDIEMALPEPEVETIPVVDTDFFSKYCFDQIEQGDTFERGILKNIEIKDIESGRLDIADRISRKATICYNWIDIENETAREFNKLVINGTEIPRYKVFSEMPYSQFRRRASS